MTPGDAGTDRWHADRRRRPPGPWTFAVEAWSDPFSTWHHAVTVKIEAGQGADDLANDLETGARLFDQLAQPLPKAERPRAVAAAAAALRDTDLDVAHRVAPALDDVPAAARRTSTRCASCVTVLAALPAVGRPRRARCTASWYEFFPRSIGAELAGDPAAPARPARHGTFKDATEHLDYVAVARLRRRLPAADPPDRRGQPQGPEQHPGRRELGRRLAVGDRLAPTAATTRSTPSSARWPTSTRSCAAPASSDMEVALDFALQCAPDHPWVDRASRVVHHQARRHHRLRREPAEEVPGHLPAQLRQRPGGPLRRVPAGRAALDRAPACTIFRVDNPHTKPLNFWQWLIGEVKQDRPGRAVPGRGVHPAGDDARAGQDRLPPELHLLHLAHRRRRSSRSYVAELVEPRALHAAELLRQHPGHPARVPAARRPGRVRDPGRAGRDAARRPGASTPATSCTSTCRCARAARSTSTRRSTSCARATSPARIADGRSLAPLHHAAQPRSAASTRRCTSCATCASTTSTTPTSPRSASATPRTGDTVLVVLHAQPARVRARRRSTSTCRRSGWTGTTASRVRDLLTGAEYRLGRAQLRPPRPVRPARAHLRTSAVTRRPHRPTARLTSEDRDRRCPTRPVEPTGAPRRPDCGSSAPSSTRSWSAASPTPTATAPATCAD